MGDIIEEVRSEGHLTVRQYNAGIALLALLHKAEGSSAGLVSQMMDKVDDATQRVQKQWKTLRVYALRSPLLHTSPILPTSINN